MAIGPIRAGWWGRSSQVTPSSPTVAPTGGCSQSPFEATDPVYAVREIKRPPPREGGRELLVTATAVKSEVEQCDSDTFSQELHWHHIFII